MNLTLSIDDEVLQSARRKAEAMGTSLNQLVREYLGQFGGQRRPCANGRRIRTAFGTDTRGREGVEIQSRRNPRPTFAPEKRAKAMALIGEYQRWGLAVISLQVSQEYFAVATGKLRVDPALAQRKVELMARMRGARLGESDVISAA